MGGKLIILLFLVSLSGGALPMDEHAMVDARPEVPVTAMYLAEERAQNSPTLAVDPTDPRFVVLASRVDAPAFSCALHVSGDGGRSWVPARPVPELPPGVDACYAPDVAFDRRGVLYFMFVGLYGKGNTPIGVFITRSEDGRTFGPPRRVLGPHRYMVRMAIDASAGEHGRLHLVWLEANSPPPLGGLPPPPNPILAAYSDDGGRTFSRPTQVSDPERERVVAPALAVGAYGALHVSYYDLEDDAIDYQGLEGPTWDGTWSVVVSSSFDRGRTFNHHAAAATGVVPPGRVMLIFTMPSPSLVADDAGGIWVSWWDSRHGDWDVFVVRSSDRGSSWGRPTRVNDDTIGNGRHQYLPKLALAPNGRLDAIFYDRRDDPTNQNNHVYYASSPNGAPDGFGPTYRVTREPSHAATGARYPVRSAVNLVEYGSRLALVAERSRVLAAWTDTRNVRWKNTHQDIFATELVLASGSRPRQQDDDGLSPVAASVVIALGLLVLADLARKRRARAAPGSRSGR